MPLSFPGRHKFNAKACVIDGIRFSSQKEARRYVELKLLARAGQIKELEMQAPIIFQINGKPMFKYLADFSYFENGSRVVEDVKGVRTPLYKLKKKLIEAQHRIRIVEV
jgi:hypothetical protein